MNDIEKAKDYYGDKNILITNIYAKFFNRTYYFSNIEVIEIRTEQPTISIGTILIISGFILGFIIVFLLVFLPEEFSLLMLLPEVILFSGFILLFIPNKKYIITLTRKKDKIDIFISTRKKYSRKIFDALSEAINEKEKI